MNASFSDEPDESSDSAELKPLRAAWWSGPPAPDLAEFLDEAVRNDAPRLLEMVRCDLQERSRVRCLDAWRGHDLAISMDHYEHVLGEIAPGSPLARLIIEHELSSAMEEGEQALAAAIDRLSDRYAGDLAAIIDNLRETVSVDWDDLTARVKSRQSAADALIGTTIGHYRVRRVIASGGMGTVYEAVQESPRRTVALKVMKHGIASKSALRRFEYESQILARLRHPGIAQVYDAGTHDDGSGSVPYFAMEYIPNAKPITQYARDKKLSTKARLELFAKVCDAVYHGHQKGIIHRDLKPGNILVDAHGQPKVIDFGVARATDSDLAVTTLQTDVGQLIGTLQYMSPEQCEADPHDIDTRSDVYALGVVLYEMLCEQLPYDVSKVALYEAARVIREEAPTRPSSFNKTLRGDIETIALKALEKERDRRYRSAADLGTDIQRYLNNQPIAARRASMMYHARTFARRNKALVGGVTAVFVVLVAGLIATSAMYVQAEHARTAEAEQRRIAEENEREAIAARESEAEQRRAAEESEKRAMESAERAEREAERALAAEAEAEQRAEELEQVAEFQQSQLADIETELMGIHIRRNIIDKRRGFMEARGMDEEDIEAALSELKQSLAGVNFTNIALETLDENIFERALKAIDEQFADQPLIRARLLQTVANTLRELGRLDRASGPQTEALKIRRRVLGDEHPNTLTSISSMGVLLVSQTKYAEAEPYLREALERRRRVLDDEHPDTLRSINNLGVLLWNRGQPAEAEPYLREALETRRHILGDAHRDTLVSMNNLSLLLRDQGKLAEAESYLREALETGRSVLGDEHPNTLTWIYNMAALLRHQGNLIAAESYYREAHDTRRRVLGDAHPDTLSSIYNLGAVLQSLGRLAEAESYFRVVLEGNRHVFGDDHTYTLNSMNSMGALLRELGQLEEAEELGAEAVETARRVLSEGHWRTATFLNQHAQTLAALERFPEAEERCLEAHAIFEAALRPDHDHTIDNINALADLYDAWHEHEPDAGYDAKAAEWRAHLEEIQSQAASDANTGGSDD